MINTEGKAMTKSMQKMSLFLVLLLFVTFVSCNYFDRKKHQNNPTAPLSAEQMANFWSGRAESENFDLGDLNGKTTFTVQAGEYLFQYVTNYGTFYVAFRAAEDATVHIGIHPEDTCHASHLFQGTIKSGAAALHTDGLVEIFSWPSASDEVSWKDVIDVPSFTEPDASPAPSDPGIPPATGDTCCFGRRVNAVFTVPPKVSASIVRGVWMETFNQREFGGGPLLEDCPLIVEPSGLLNTDYSFVGNLTTEGSWDVLFHLAVQLMDNLHGAVIKEAETSWYADPPGSGGNSDEMLHQHIYDLAKTFVPLDDLLFAYEGLPQTATVTPAKNPVKAGEQMTIQVNVGTNAGIALQPWQWVLVRAEKGKILNGVFEREYEGFEYRRFQVGEGTITLNYQAPPEELAPTVDTVAIYNTCNIDNPKLTQYMIENEIGKATFEISKPTPEEPSISPPLSPEPETSPGFSGGYCKEQRGTCPASGVLWMQMCVDENQCVYYIFGNGAIANCADSLYGPTCRELGSRESDGTYIWFNLSCDVDAFDYCQFGYPLRSM